MTFPEAATSFDVAGAADTLNASVAPRPQSEIIAAEGMSLLAMGRTAPPSATDYAALGGRVPHVVGLRSLHKVRRIAARRVVAPVIDDQAFVNGAMRQRPRESVCQDASAGTVATTADTNQAVSVGQPIAAPRPAIVGIADLDTGPEALRQRSRFRSGHGYNCTRFPWALPPVVTLYTGRTRTTEV